MLKMADSKPVVQIGENSPEQVAYKLMELVAEIEEKSIQTKKPSAPGWTAADRKWILDTYSECLQAAKGYRSLG
jgi:hypothetical protein